MMTKKILSLTIILLLITLLDISASKPNVVLIIIDDVGYGDLSSHGNPYVTTPSLDKLNLSSPKIAGQSLTFNGQKIVETSPCKCCTQNWSSKSQLQFNCFSKHSNCLFDTHDMCG